MEVNEAVERDRGELMAPRTVRHVYGTLHTMLHDGVVDELISANPCVLRRGELPKKIDQDPTWRDGAVFTRDEAEQLISGSRVPEHRRVWNALLFLGGLRFGEAAALRWRHYDATVEPLGRLNVAGSWDSRLRGGHQSPTISFAQARRATTAILAAR